ncbi:MAG: hypothetical protein OEY87_05255 [Gammaproteobacteria bacterium]|nr:hypothetical protein [Gammaproteobacteria bacterium]MDH5735513.1 hypothetical protein [Gammaproteobacteria bacterium]
MIGKKNIVFGFLYLVVTAALGPVMVTMYDDYYTAIDEKQQLVGRLQALQQNQFEEDLETLSAEQIARANTDGILSLNKILNIENSIDSIKGGAHAHGNLEALLNIIIGVVLGYLLVASWLKQLISWLFITGAIMHSGMLYVSRIFESTWAESILNTGIGPICLLSGLLLAGIASAIGYQTGKQKASAPDI